MLAAGALTGSGRIPFRCGLAIAGVDVLLLVLMPSAEPAGKPSGKAPAATGSPAAPPKSPPSPAAAAASFSLFNGVAGTVRENSGLRFLTLLGEPEGYSNPFRVETGDGNYERGYSIVELELQRGGLDLETGWLSARSVCVVRTDVGLVKYVAGTVEVRLSRNEAGEPVLTVTCPRGSAEVSYVNFSKDAAYTKAVVRGGYLQVTQNQAAGRTTVTSGDATPALPASAKEAPAAK